MMDLRDLVVESTPVELYSVNGKEVWVKREDLSAKPPLPPFSKVRGLATALTNFKQNGTQVVGYCETSISMAGIGVAAGCFLLGLTCVIFNPIYKEPIGTLLTHREHWKMLGATIMDIPAGMAKVNWHLCKKRLKQLFGKEAVMLPLGIPFPETVDETAKEFIRTTWGGLAFKNVVVNVGSGTICSGILKGMESGHLIGVMGRTGNVKQKRQKIIRLSGKLMEGVFANELIELSIIDPGYEYTDSVDFPCPFPTNKFYDLKAWKWLVENLQHLKEPVMFWNIGRDI